MQEMVKLLGADKVEVLLLSVDASSFNGEKDNLKKAALEKAALERDAAILTKKSITWPNVLLPGGFDTLKERFNLLAFGLSVIGPDGKALAIGFLEPKELLAAIKESQRDKSAQK